MRPKRQCFFKCLQILLQPKGLQQVGNSFLKSCIKRHHQSHLPMPIRFLNILCFQYYNEVVTLINFEYVASSGPPSLAVCGKGEALVRLGSQNTVSRSGLHKDFSINKTLTNKRSQCTRCNLFLYKAPRLYTEATVCSLLFDKESAVLECVCQS